MANCRTHWTARQSCQERQSKLGLRRSLGKGKKFQKSFKYLPLLDLVRFYARFIKFALDFSCPLADNVGVGERHETKTQTKGHKMTAEQIQKVVCSIVTNEPLRLICELSNSEIAGYLVDHNLDETSENIIKIRNYANGIDE